MEQKETATGGQGLEQMKHLERSVVMLEIMVLVLVVGFAVLAWRYLKIVHILGQISEIIRLLSLQLGTIKGAT